LPIPLRGTTGNGCPPRGARPGGSGGVRPLYELNFDPVNRYCYHRLGSWGAAEDATSIVFTSVLAALPRYRSDDRSGAFRSWLLTIAHNVFVNQTGADFRRRTLLLNDVGEEDPGEQCGTGLHAEAHGYPGKTGGRLRRPGREQSQSTPQPEPS
jgi:DNA-directed RNA polymerase specialized sigma24 family protein